MERPPLEGRYELGPIIGSGGLGTSTTSRRLTTLPPSGVAALRETLRYLDLPMLDAFARRERGSAMGRIARALALAFRLELDAAALILEPLAAQSDVARAVGAAVVAPRARRVTRARVDDDRDDRWTETLDPELAAMFVALATALGVPDTAARDAERCASTLGRLEASAETGANSAREATRTTLRVAHAAARARLGEVDRGVARDLVAPLLFRGERGRDERSEEPFHAVVRALCAATLASEHTRDVTSDALAELVEVHGRVAAETGAPLLDAAAAITLGNVLLARSARDERALAMLERAATLLAHGDAPSLEHEAENQRGAALTSVGRWREAIAPLRAARGAAHAERAGELELHSVSLEVMAELALGDHAAAYESAAILGESRLRAASGRVAALGWLARSLTSLSASDLDAAEDALAEAEARVREADRRTVDVYVLVEVVGMLLDAARGALTDVSGPVSTLERLAEEHGFEGFHWVELVNAVVARLPEGDGKPSMSLALARLEPVLGPRSRLARERRTDAPPSMAL